MEIYAVIMAGGTGTRFWPLSRKKKPKQFLPIISEKSMLEETVGRLHPDIPHSHIYCIANPAQTKIIKNLLPHLPEENLLIEPQAKNTAPSLILATAKIFLRDPDGVIAALPADHLITNPDLFRKKLEAAAIAASKGDHIVTFGIPPAFPSTGYGYIQFSMEKSFILLGETFYNVEKFREKPGMKKANEFIKSGNYFWNSGMFIWRASEFALKLENYAPTFFLYWRSILEALRKNNESRVAKIFQMIPSISIDYALMEQAKGVLMCEGNFGWSDVGAWSSLADIWPQDENGNALRGENIVLDTKNCLLYSPRRLTALIGAEDLIIVDTKDALLICRKGEDQKVRDIVESLKRNRKGKYT